LGFVGGHSFYQNRLLLLLSLVWLSHSFYLEGLVYILMSFEETLPNSEQKYSATIIETAYFLGIGIGSLTLSWYSNNFGRKPALLICQGILAFGLLGSNFASTTDVYAAFCFIIGLGFGGAEFACFVLLSEFVDVQNRNTYLGLM
jgi:MFS family permease